MNVPKIRAALIVFLVGFALGLSVFAASRMFVRLVLSTEAAAAARELALQIASGEPVEATAAPSIVERYTYLGLDGEVLKSGSLSSGSEAGSAAATPEMLRLAEQARGGDTVVQEAPLLSSLLGLADPVVTSVAVPVVTDGATSGSLVVEIDQTQATEALKRAFSIIGMVTVGLAALALVVILFALSRGGGRSVRRAFRSKGPQVDYLTGLPTREGFKGALEEAVAQATKADQSVGLLILNLSGFRTVNDIWGHAAGDAVLADTAERLRGFVESDAALARISGDHFAIVVAGDANAQSMRQLANRLQDAIRAPFKVGESSIALDSKVGVALFPVNADNADMLFRAADIALSKAKAQRHETFAVFDTDLKRRMQRRATLERDLRDALGRDEFVVFYQPQLELATGRLRGYEALLRWERPGEGILSPTEFLTVAQETGLIRPLGDWVLRKACEDAVRWADGGVVAVNFSAAQFRFQDLEQSIASALKDTGLPAERLEIEVPESLFLEHAPEVMETLSRIKALGVRIAMDDFGSEYSGLSSLAQFPFDKIKIDRSFVGQLTEDHGVAAIVASIVGLGRSLTMDITAEGVETAEQVTLLKAAGCSIVQGYLFGIPARTDDGAATQDQPPPESGEAAVAASA